MVDKITIDGMAVFCKKKGFVYPSGEIYGGLAGFWDFGPLGSEFKRNVKNEWWKFHVQDREDIVGIDGSIITNPMVWKASGHVDSFTDILVDCKKCGMRYRADMLIEDVLKVKTEGMKKKGIIDLLKKIKCPKCKSDLGKPKDFNLMFQTNVGPISGNIAYLRPETAQVIFADFKLVADNARLKLPFGIAQMGKAYRNEISPRDFLFRSREFEQMEIEYFVHPDKVNDCPYIKEVLNYKINVLSAEAQSKNKEHGKMTMKEALDKDIIKTTWHAYWLAMEHKWFVGLGADASKFRIRQHTPDELSHYALDTWDLEYEFPFGWKELQGMANRTDFDLKQHIKFSKVDLSLFDQESGKKVIPHVVAEPSQGVERAMLVFLFDAYSHDKKRGNVVLKFHPRLAPIKVGVFPLVKNKPEIVKKAREIYEMLKEDFVCKYDEAGSIGRRYARQDEIGTPLNCTIDFESIKNDDCTLRDRNTTKQIRVKVKDLKEVVQRFFQGEKFEKLGKLVK